MPWRETFLDWFGPGLLGGISTGDWLKMLRENRFAVAPRRFTRAMAVTSQSLGNTAWRKMERLRFGRRIRDAVIQPPLFVLGHWRSGTTHLHNLITIDPRFAFPNNYQVFFPHTFLSTEAWAARMIGFFLPKRRPMDNIEWGMASPQEDEFAMCVDSFMSPYMGWVFPDRREKFDRYLTFREASEEERSRWRASLVLFLKKLTVKHGKPLVLKSPPHTCRIKLLLEMFPEARFVHIHRDPFAVFQSTRHTWERGTQTQGLQRPRVHDLDELIIRQYREMHDAFFEEKGLIRPGRFHELSYEALERDPVGAVRKIYESLALPDFAEAEPGLRTYVDSLAGYRKNAFPALPGDLRKRISKEWRRCFEAWSYPP